MLLMKIYVLGNNINKHTEALIDVRKEVGLRVSSQKTKYTLMSRHQNAGQSHNKKTAGRSFENVVRFRYLETTITDKNIVQEDNKSRLNSGKALLPFSSESFVFSSAV
jgi:hypothetical protein